MIHHLHDRLPHFRVTTLMWVTVAVALGVAISQGPPASHPQFSAQYLMFYSWSEGLQATGAVFILYALSAQVREFLTLNRVVRPEYRFDATVCLAHRIAVAISLAGLLVAQLLINRGWIPLPQRDERLLLWIDLWPNLLLMLCLFVSLVSLSATTKAINQPTIGRRVVRSSIITCVVVLMTWALIERTIVTALVHIATQGIEFASPLWLQRQDVFPDHRSEGYRTFWVATAAAIAVPVAVGLLYTAFRTPRRGLGRLCGAAFTIMVIGLGTYVWWFGQYEAPRLNPDFASAVTARRWTDTLAGWCLVGGVAAAIGLWIARRRILESGTQELLFPQSGFAWIGAVAAALAQLILLVDYLRLSTDLMLAFSMSNVWTAVQQIAYYLIKPESLIALMVLLAATRLLWQTYRQVPVALTLTTLRPQTLGLWVLVCAALLIVGVPTLTIFSLCYWLGPFILL